MCLFDPLSCIVKLAILNKKKYGTKLSIKNCVITIQEPGYFQGIIRYVSGDTHFDIKYMISPIIIACEIYLSEQYRTKFKKIVNLFNYALSGINYLIKLYNNHIDTIKHLENIKNIIEYHLYKINVEQKDNDKLVIRIGATGIFVLEDFMSSNKINDLNLDKYLKNLNLYNNDLINKLSSVWTDDKINQIINLIDSYNRSTLNIFKNGTNKFINKLDDEIVELFILNNLFIN